MAKRQAKAARKSKAALAAKQQGREMDHSRMISGQMNQLPMEEGLGRSVLMPQGTERELQLFENIKSTVPRYNWTQFMKVFMHRLSRTGSCVHGICVGAWFRTSHARVYCSLLIRACGNV